MDQKNPVQAMADQLRGKVAEAKISDDAIKATTDYSIFKKHVSNREVNPDGKYVEELAKSIKYHNRLSIRPIDVNEKMEVIDGQHRLEAAKMLKVPIYYRVTAKLEDEDMLNLNVNQKPWALADYLNHYCQKRNENYIKFRDFIENEGFKIVEGLLALHDGQKKGSSKGFQRGQLKFPQGEELKKVNEKVEKYQRVINLLKKKNLDVPAYLRSSNFKTALLRFVDVKAVDIDYFLTRLELKLETLRMTTSTGAYLAQFEAIYNFGTKVNKLDLNKELEGSLKSELIQTTLI